MAKTKENKVNSNFGTICGTTTVGERGQVVVPKEARERLRLKTGDRFIVIEHYGKIVLIPEKEMRTMVDQITKHLK